MTRPSIQFILLDINFTCGMCGCRSDKTVHWNVISRNYLHVERVAVLVTRPSIKVILLYMTFTCETCIWSQGGVQPEKLGGGCAARFPKPWPKSAIFPTLFMAWGPFLERPGNSTCPKSYFEIKVSRKVYWVLTSYEVHFVSLVNNFTVQFSKLLKLPSGMENKTA